MVPTPTPPPPPRLLRTAVDSCLSSSSPPSPAQQIELLHVLRHSLPSLRSLFSYPPPQPSDRAQLQSKQVRLPDTPPIPLDDQDVQIAIKLSDELHLNEIDCVRLLVSANQQWGLMGRDQLEIQRLAAGLWYTERRDLITALFLLLRAVVLDHVVEADLKSEIQKHLEDLLSGGLRQRLISLIKELNREDPTGFGGPLCDRYVIDSKGVLVERRAVVDRERLFVGHCLVLSILVVRASTKDAKDILFSLKDNAAELTQLNDIVKHRITLSLLFSLIINFISDALSAVSDRTSILARDASFRKEFHETVMAAGNNPKVEGFIGCLRLAWAVCLMLINDENAARETVSNISPNDLDYLRSCLENVFSNNVFQFVLDNILRTAAYQNDDEDMVYIYNAYLHKLITCFLSHALARDKVKESKEKAMSELNSYRVPGTETSVHDMNYCSEETAEPGLLTFVCLLEFVSEIYQREPELLSGNDVLWTFVSFAGEDHTNFKTLVAFLKMLSTLACSQEGASKVYELLHGRAFRSVGWSTLFDCLTIYDERFKQSLQTPGAMLPDFQEGDARALVAYLDVLQKVVEHGDPAERKKWFPDIEPLFKLLSYENVPPYLKGALRNTVATLVRVSPELKDAIWGYLEQYDLPVVVGTHVGNGAIPMPPQVYDMQCELNEIEASRERYPSTTSYINLLNVLIAEEKKLSDRGHRFIGIFRFVYDHVFGPFPQRAYADPREKWQLLVACLQYFHMTLSMYEIQDEDIDDVVGPSQLRMGTQSAMQLPAIELLKDFMSGKVAFRNTMGIILPGVDVLIAERTSQIYGQLLEKAVQLSLEIIILVFEKDLVVSEYWRPLYQPLDVILSQDHSQIVALLEYVRYDFVQEIQKCSIKIMNILSSRVVGLVPLLLKSNAASSLVEDYATCLEFQSGEAQIVEKYAEDPGVLIMQILIDNISRPAPNVTHFLLRFDLDSPVERTVLQPKVHYSCLKVILEILDELPKRNRNPLLLEFGFQLLYELCVDPLTSCPTMDLLSNRKYQFFVKHLDALGVAPLPKRSNNQPLRISSLQQRAWLLKLLAVQLHSGHMGSSVQRETCQTILAHLFGPDLIDRPNHVISDSFALVSSSLPTSMQTLSKSKVLELLEILRFRPADISMKLSQVISNSKYNLLAEDILRDPTTSEKGGIYYYSERGDRLIDLTSFHDKLSQKFDSGYLQMSNFAREAEFNDVKEIIQQLLRWGWKYNKNLEEQAAQLHMLLGWSQIVEVAVSRRITSLEHRCVILHQVLDASLSASASPDCSLRMAYVLTQVALTCMAKLRDEGYLCHAGLNADSITSLDVIMVKQLSNGACHSLLFKLVMATLRNESSEALRRRQYALLLSYFQYCRHMLDPDIPTTILRFLLQDDQDSEEFDIRRIDREQAELAHANFSIVRKETQAILDVVIKDATQGSEPGKTIAIYVLDALICIDHEKYFFNQLQSRGFLRSCLMSISNFSFQESGHSVDFLQRGCTIEALLALLLRISHKYGKSGAQVLFSMGALEHISSCRAISLKASLRRFDPKLRRDVAVNVDRQQMIVTPILRLGFSLTTLIDTADIFEVKNKIVREMIDFVKGHQFLFDQILQEDISEADELTMEQVNLAVGILSKVWPYEETDEFGFVQGLFSLMHALFSRELEIAPASGSTCSSESKRNYQLNSFRLCSSLSSYLYFLVTKKALRLQVSDKLLDRPSRAGLRQPTLMLLGVLLNSATTSLERAAEEKSLLLNKIRDINELSRQEVDEIISTYVRQDCILCSDDIQKRRYIAMVEMCQVAGGRDQLIALLLPLVEHLLNIIFIHFDEGTAANDDVSVFCGELVPSLEQLELINEEKVGQNLKVFRRLATSLKEMAIRKLA